MSKDVADRCANCHHYRMMHSPTETFGQEGPCADSWCMCAAFREDDEE